MLVAVAMLIIASAVAGCTVRGATEPVSIVIPAYHVGDSIRYMESYEWLDDGVLAGWSGGTVLRVEDRSEATDRWGRTMPTVPVRQDWLEGDTKYAASRCHVLADGVELVHEEILEGLAYRTDIKLFGTVDYPQQWDVGITAIFRGTCWLFPALAGRTLDEGDRLAADDLALSIRFLGIEGESSPAVSSMFDGRPALMFAFPGDASREIPEVRLILADGIPGPASLDAVWPDGSRALARIEGHEAGSGVEVRDHGARMPGIPARVQFQTADWMRVDHSAWPLRYSFDDAMTAILSNPEGRELATFLETHPAAVLRHAFYRGGETSEEGDLVADGSWVLGYSDGTDAKACTTMRIGGTRAGVPIPDSLKPNHVNCWGPEPDDHSSFAYPAPIPATFPRHVATSASMAATATNAGIPPENVVNLRYWLFSGASGAVAMYSLEDTPYHFGREMTGTAVHLENEEASLWDIRTMGMSTTVVPLAGARTLPAIEPPLASPAVPTILAAGVGAVVIGGILLKVLAALYTRLVAAQLLENPVRARLYERIRVEPGIHREDLIDFAGIGNGATRHHLRKLASHGYVLEIVVSGFARYYPSGEVPPALARQHAMLRTGRAAEVFELFDGNPSLSLREAARELGMSAPSVHRVRKRLEREGLLAKRPLESLR